MGALAVLISAAIRIAIVAVVGYFVVKAAVKAAIKESKEENII